MLIPTLKNLCWSELFKRDDLDELIERERIPKDLMDFLDDLKKINLNSSDRLAEASSKGLLKVVKYIYEIFKPRYKDAIYEACEHGHLDIIKYFHEEAKIYIGCATRNPVQNGHLHIVKYLVEVVKIKCNNNHEDICFESFYIGSKGHLEILKYLYKRGINLNYKNILRHANVYNHIDMIKYFHNETDVKCNIKDCNYCNYCSNSKYKVFAKLN